MFSRVLARSRTAGASPRAYSKQPNVVNQVYLPGIPKQPCPVPSAQCTRSNCICKGKDVKTILKKHTDKKWTAEEVEAAAKKHSVMTWGATDPMLASTMWPVKGDGIYFTDNKGKKWIDWNSMAMCSNLGHTVLPSVQAAINEQLSAMPYGYPGVSFSPIRAKISELLSDICPGDLNHFAFPSTGMEANETALRIARTMTKKHKVLSRYRSYHGSSVATMGLTGDHRRWPSEAGATGHIHFFDPWPYSFSWGNTEEEITQNNLTYLKELIEYEGPHTIAAIFLESVTGTNGILKPPRGYLEGIRHLCDQYNILMVCDEVMAGFGRTGKLFGFCHAPDVIPDIFTGAKGVNAAVLPLGVVGMRDHIAEYFMKNPINIGSTYNSHPVALASSYATLKYILEKDIIGHVAKMESVMEHELKLLASKHPSVKQARVVGLFGTFDVCKNRKGDFTQKVFEAPTAAMAKFKAALYQHGLFTFVRGHQVMCNPPLIITPEQIKEGFSIIDKCLYILDEAMDEE